MAIDLLTGWLPHASDAITFRFEDYADMSELPKVPSSFGHEEYTPPVDWGVLGNDKWGDCVVAGGCHEHMLWNRIAGRTVTFNTDDVGRDFRAMTGLPPNPITGADMHTSAKYRLRTGLLDSAGVRHKIGAYMELQPGNLQQLYAAIYLFDAVGVAFRFYNAWFDQFRRREAWRIETGMTATLMGHYVPLVALRGNLVGVTWGRFQAIRPSVYLHAAQQVVACVSQESMLNQKSPLGFNWDQLIADANAIVKQT
jgi:hypothetical protein